VTAFDDRLVTLIADMAVDGDVHATADELAFALDCSAVSVRRSLGRLVNEGRIEVIPNSGRASVLRLPGGSARTDHPDQPRPTPPTGGCGSVADDPDQGDQPRRTPPGRSRPAQKSTDPDPPPSLPHPDRHCPRCEGTGWQFTGIDRNIVAACDCRGPETIAYQRQRQRDLDRTWGWQAKPPDEAPAKSDYVDVWRQMARRQLNGDQADIDRAVGRHPSQGVLDDEPPPRPTETIDVDGDVL
jgi:hypothetical protein